MVQLTPTKKARIWDWRKQHMSWAEMSRRLGNIHPTTISKAYRAMESQGPNPDFYYRKPIPGRPPKLSEADGQYAELLIKRGHAQCAVDLQNNYFPHAGVKAVRGMLARRGLHARIRRKKPWLASAHIRARKIWAHSTSGWTIKQWKHCVFSDESKYNLFGSDGKQWCWRRDDEAYLDRNVVKVVKHGGGSLMVWGCITWDGVGRLHRIDGRLTGIKYTRILENTLLPSLKDRNRSPQSVVFVQDRDPKHRSRVAGSWFAHHRILVLPWPASSPDMNIIEHVWVYLERRLRRRKVLPRNLDELWAALQEEWVAIDTHYIRSLYRSMPSRVASLKAAKGRHTRY